MANKITTLFDFKGSGLEKIKADINGVDGAWNKAKTGFKSAANEFRQSNVAQGALIGGLLVGAKKAIDASSSLGESQNAVNVTFNEGADAIARLGDSSVDSYGLSERAFNQMSVAFSGFAEQVAGDGGDVSEVIDQMATRIADFGSVHELTTDEAMQKFQSALAGEAEAMRRYGIDVSAAAVETFAYANGIAEAGDKLTEAQKVQARYGLIMQETSQWAGDFANTSDSLANSQKRLAAESENAQAKLGEGLTPALAKAEQGMIRLVETADKLKILDAISLDWVETVGTTLGRVLSPWNEGARSANKAITDAFNDAESAAKSFDMTLTDNAKTFDEARQIALDYAKANGNVGDELHFANKVALEWNATTGAGIKETQAAADAIRAEAEALRDSGEASTYNADATDEMGRIQRLTNDIVDKAREAQEKYLRSIRHTRDEVGKLKRDIDDRQAWLNLQAAIEDVTAQQIDMTNMTREQELAVLSLKQEVIDYAEQINLPDSVVTNIMAQIDQGGLDNVNSLLERLGNGVTLPIKPVVIGGGKNGGTFTGGVRVDEFGNVKAYGAEGGIVTRPTVALIGEAGPEAVVPLNKTPGSSPLPTGGMGSPVINATFNFASAPANVDEFARDVRKALEREMRWNGKISGW